jgi:hypothetical protein
MENKPQETDSIHIQGKLSNTEEKAFWQQFKQTNGLTENSETLRAVVNQLRALQSSPTLKTSMPQEIEETLEKCKKKGCPAYPYFDADAQEMLCVFTSEGKEPKILHRSFVEFEACSDSPILVSKARKKELEEDFQYRTETLTAQIDRAAEDHADDKALTEKLIERDNERVIEHAKDTTEIRRLAWLLGEKGKANDKLTRQLQPMKTYITKNEKLSNWRLHTANYLLRVLKEKDTLEMDNDFLIKRVEELSHDSLAEKNAFLTVQDGKKDEQIVGLNAEIEKVQALAEKRLQTLNEVISKASSLFRELRQFVPLYAKGYADMTENFEGYLKTVAPKDSLERFI